MEDLHKPAYPESCTADGYKATVDTGLTKLEHAALIIAGHILSMPDSWNIIRADKKPEGPGWMFDRQKIARNAVSVAKAIFEECEKQKEEL